MDTGQGCYRESFDSILLTKTCWYELDYMRIRLAVIAVFFTFIWAGISYGSEQTRLIVGGTGSSLGFMRLLGKSYSAYYPEVTVEVLPSLGTSGGIRALKSGAIDVAVAGRHLTDHEKIGLHHSFLGKSPVVFAVHPGTPVEEITLSEIVNIYDGTNLTWSDQSRIRIFLRPTNDTDWQLMNSFSPELTRALQIARENEGIYLAITDSDAITYLENVRGSIGPATLTMIAAERRRVKILHYHGRNPDAANHIQEKYPMQKSYFLLSRIDTTPAVAKFVDYIQSPQGQKILSQVAISKHGTDLK
jgi:phosphate transport system substrate-binding protein